MAKQRIPVIALALLVVLATACVPNVQTVDGRDARVTIAGYDSTQRGAYIVEQAGEGGRTVAYCAEPPPDTAANTRLALSADAALSGLLGAAVPQPVPTPPVGASLTITATPTSATLTLTGPDGSSRELASVDTVANLTPGAYTLTAIASGFLSASKSFNVPAGATVLVTVGLVPTPAMDAEAQPTSEEVAGRVDRSIQVDIVPAAAQGSGGDAAFSFGLQTARDIVQLAERTELIEIQRQALYRLCEMRANAFIDDNEAFLLANEILFTIRVLSLGELIRAANQNDVLSDEALDTVVTRAGARGELTLVLPRADGGYDVLFQTRDGSILRASTDAVDVIDASRYEQSVIDTRDSAVVAAARGDGAEVEGLALLRLRAVCQERPFDTPYPAAFLVEVHAYAVTPPGDDELAVAALGGDSEAVATLLASRCDAIGE